MADRAAELRRLIDLYRRRLNSGVGYAMVNYCLIEIEMAEGELNQIDRGDSGLRDQDPEELAT